MYRDTPSRRRASYGYTRNGLTGAIGSLLEILVSRYVFFKMKNTSISNRCEGKIRQNSKFSPLVGCLLHIFIVCDPTDCDYGCDPTA